MPLVKFVIRLSRIKRNLKYGISFMVEKEMSDSVISQKALIEINKLYHIPFRSSREEGEGTQVCKI